MPKPEKPSSNHAGRVGTLLGAMTSHIAEMLIAIANLTERPVIIALGTLNSRTPLFCYSNLPNPAEVQGYLARLAVAIENSTASLRTGADTVQ